MEVHTPIVQPGLYVVSVTSESLLSGLLVWNMDPPFTLYFGEDLDHVNLIGVQFQIHAPIRLHIIVKLRSIYATGEIGLFVLGPRGYVGPSS